MSEDEAFATLEEAATDKLNASRTLHINKQLMRQLLEPIKAALFEYRKLKALK